MMKTKIFALALGVLFAMPSVLRADEVEIQLQEVITMGSLLGDAPLDDPIQSPGVPTRPTNFHASLVNGHTLSIIKQEPAIPSAQATVVNVTSGSIVLNQPFTDSLSEQIANTGVYVLHIETATGALIGQFVVQ